MSTSTEASASLPTQPAEGSSNNQEPEEWQIVSEIYKKHVDTLISERFRLPPSSVPSPGERPYVVNYLDELSYLSDREKEITKPGQTATALLKKLHLGEYTATEVITAFVKRAGAAHQLTNCLIEPLFHSALNQAERLDAAFAKNGGRPIGPLHGLPISVKDQFVVEPVRDQDGSDPEEWGGATVGYMASLPERFKESGSTAAFKREDESWIVTKLKEAGAVILAKTNVPTSLMALETNNNIVGYTTNPYNRALSSGGSSGGEASLLAQRGSILGLGTDLAASVRLPAGLQGLCGFKPSTGRVPYRGVANSMEGNETNTSVIGPLGHSLADVRLFMKFVAGLKPWLADPKLAPIPWRNEIETEVKDQASISGLAFGIVRSDGVIKPHPPVERALRELEAKLKAAGHEVIDWDPPSHQQAFEILWGTFIADGGVEIHDQISKGNEPPVPHVQGVYGEKQGHLPVPTVNDAWSLQKRRAEYQRAYLDYWNKSSTLTKSGRTVDAVILPLAPSASYEPGGGLYPGYTGVVNILDYPAAVIPTDTVDKKVDIKNKGYKPEPGLDEMIWNTYDPELFHSMPVAAQVMGRRLEEEKTLAVAEEVRQCAKYTDLAHSIQ